MAFDPVLGETDRKGLTRVFTSTDATRKGRG